MTFKKGLHASTSLARCKDKLMPDILQHVTYKTLNIIISYF